MAWLLCAMSGFIASVYCGLVCKANAAFDGDGIGCRNHWSEKEGRMKSENNGDRFTHRSHSRSVAAVSSGSFSSLPDEERWAAVVPQLDAMQPFVCEFV